MKIPVMKLLPKDIVLQLLEASEGFNKFFPSMKRVSAIDEITKRAREKHPHLYRKEALNESKAN